MIRLSIKYLLFTTLLLGMFAAATPVNALVDVLDKDEISLVETEEKSEKEEDKFDDEQFFVSKDGLLQEANQRSLPIAGDEYINKAFYLSVPIPPPEFL